MLRYPSLLLFRVITVERFKKIDEILYKTTTMDQHSYYFLNEKTLRSAWHDASSTK